MKKIISIVVLSLFLSMPVLALADTATTSNIGLTPDSSFYFFKTLKENIQTFFTFNAENKAKQFLHLADVRMAEYQKMVEKGKTEIAQKTLDKYEKQLNKATQKIEELRSEGKDIKNISEKIATTTAKHIKTLEDNLQKVPESAKKGLEKALENTKKGIEKFKTKNATAGWKIYNNSEVDFTFRYPSDWQILEDFSAGKSIIVGKDNTNSNDWIRINPRQFQTSEGVCLEVSDNTVCTYSKNPEILRIFNQIISTFKFTK